MKKFWMLSFVLAPLLAGSAQAVVGGDAERPIRRAQMEVIEAASSMADVRSVELVMTQREGARTPTGFVLTIDGRSIGFDVSRAQPRGCGEMLYMGMTGGHSQGHVIRLAVLDHTARSCSGSPGQLHTLPVNQPLEAVLMDGNQSLLHVAGTPEDVRSLY